MQMPEVFSLQSASSPLVRALAPLALVMVMCVLGTGALYSLQLCPAQERLSNAERVYQTEKDTQSRLKLSRRQFEDARAVRRRLDEVWNKLPAQQEFAPFALAVTELGRSERVVIPGMKYEVHQAESGLPAKASVSFTVRGEYTALYRFLRRLETSDSYVIVEHLDVTHPRISEATTNGMVEFQVRLSTFLRPNPPNPRMS